MRDHNYYDALERFKTYFSLAHYTHYENEDSGTYTIKSLAEFMDIPVPVFRQDLLQLRSVLNPSTVFMPELIYDEDILSSLYLNLLGVDHKGNEDLLEQIEEYLENSGDIDDMIIKGVLDDVPFSIIDNYRHSDALDQEQVEVPVSIDEYLAYNNLFEQNVLPKRASNEVSDITSVLRNKKYICEFKPEVLEILDALEEEIKNNGCVKFDYHPVGEKDLQNIYIKPLKIGFDSTENRYVVITCEDNRILTYDLEYISNIKHAKDNGIIPPPDLFKYADKVWGFEYDKCFYKKGKFKKPIRVKVEFYNEGNVINKVHRDLEFRKPISLKTDKNGNLTYVDNVYGKDSFLNWVCSYGSSAVILSPKSLIDDIVERFSKTNL